MLNQSISGTAIGGQVKPAPPVGKVNEHAALLHELASRIESLNSRGESLIARLFAEPTEQAPGSIPAQPDGALLVAAFGAERIRLECERLNRIINKLEELG